MTCSLYINKRQSVLLTNLKKKRGLNCHTLEDGYRKPKDEDVGIATHAMRENRLLPCIFKKISYVLFYK